MRKTLSGETINPQDPAILRYINIQFQNFKIDYWETGDNIYKVEE
jgi:uncharacterized protein (DUF2249 family)